MAAAQTSSTALPRVYPRPSAPLSGILPDGLPNAQPDALPDAVPAALPDALSPRDPRGFTMFQGEKIDLHWHCHVDKETEKLRQPGKHSQQRKYKIVCDNSTKEWLQKFINDLAKRDEIMWYGSSNINESINNVYARYADKRYDFRFVEYITIHV